MKIDRITLHNFKCFEGTCSINGLGHGLTSKERIILFGGLNGAGKTTLFESILLCLYGKRNKTLWPSKGTKREDYQNYIVAVSNNNATSKEIRTDLWIELQLCEIDLSGIAQSLSVRRFWTIDNQTHSIHSENLTISDEKGKPFDFVSENDWEDFIDELIPYDISQFFFFDGEKIQDFVKDEFAESLEKVLGISLYDQLNNDLNTAICELVDNAIDVWIEKNQTYRLTITIEIDTDQQKILITDNAAGVKESELKKLIAPGESTVTGVEKSIGIFGVGSKRAVVALSQLIRITTRYQDEKTFRVEYDDEWLQSSDWHVNYELVEDLPPNTTKVELSDLRFRVEGEDIEKLCTHLSETFAHFLRDKNIQIQVHDLLNEWDINAKFFENWAYPPKYEPQRFKKTLQSKNNKKVELEITTGLVNEKGNLTDYGVYFYCNKRMICKALRVPEVGFISGVAGTPHHTMCLARTFVKIEGPSDCMPWTSNKAGIHYNHWIFQALRKDFYK